MSRHSMAFKTWLDADPLALLALGMALGAALLVLFKAFRGSGEEEERRHSEATGERAAAAAQKPATVAAAVASHPTPEQALRLIKDRRSIMPKDYLDALDHPVTDGELELILEAANWAPTHGKTEPWRYVVMTGPGAILSYLDYLEDWYRARKDELPEEAVAKFENKLQGVRTQWPGRVGRLLIIGMKRQALKEKLMPEWEELCAVAMSVQNAHLMASALGLGLFWSSHTWCKDARDGPDLKKRLGFEEEDKILGALTLGRCQDPAKFRSTRGPVKDKVQHRKAM